MTVLEAVDVEEFDGEEDEELPTQCTRAWFSNREQVVSVSDELPTALLSLVSQSTAFTAMRLCVRVCKIIITTRIKYHLLALLFGNSRGERTQSQVQLVCTVHS